ncbi:hypothetical protein GCM10009745_38610 [Kribbella yunnanensis]|uniref:Secreted protein n=1 Tax=Kribbella yunnanensis TaxID=190194 RepID=A0ABP4TKE7_9ACTN
MNATVKRLATRLLRAGAAGAALAGLVTGAPASAAAPAASCPAGYYVFKTGPTYWGCAMNGQKYASVYWSGGGRKVAVVGVDYRIYYFSNQGKFFSLKNGIAGSAGSGIFWTTTEWTQIGHEPIAGYFKVLGNDNRTPYCIKFDKYNLEPRGDWYRC